MLMFKFCYEYLRFYFSNASEMFSYKEMFYSFEKWHKECVQQRKLHMKCANNWIHVHRTTPRTWRHSTSTNIFMLSTRTWWQTTEQLYFYNESTMTHTHTYRLQYDKIFQRREHSPGYLWGLAFYSHV